MYVARVPNRGSPPAILLRESYREGGKVKNRTLANLSRWPEHKVDALSRALKGLPPARDLSEAFEAEAVGGVGGWPPSPWPSAPLRWLVRTTPSSESSLPPRSGSPLRSADWGSLLVAAPS